MRLENWKWRTNSLKFVWCSPYRSGYPQLFIAPLYGTLPEYSPPCLMWGPLEDWYLTPCDPSLIYQSPDPGRVAEMSYRVNGFCPSCDLESVGTLPATCHLASQGEGGFFGSAPDTYKGSNNFTHWALLWILNILRVGPSQRSLVSLSLEYLGDGSLYRD